MKLLITGCKGQVGVELQHRLAAAGEVIAVDRRRCDLSDPGSVRACVRAVRPDWIFNAAAYTAVDKAESERDLAFAINAVAPGVLAEEAARLGAGLVHYSTDYVFDGTGERPWREDDAVAPLNVYGESKLAGEQAIRAVMAETGVRAWILRTTWVFAAQGGNFLRTMLRLAREREQLSVVADQIGAPTSAALIAEVSAAILARSPTPGLYHLAAAGATSWHEYAGRVIALAAAQGLPLRLDAGAVRGIASSEYPTPARRPLNSRLDCGRLELALGLRLPPWQQDVDAVTRALVRELSG